MLNRTLCVLGVGVKQKTKTKRLYKAGQCEDMDKQTETSVRTGDSKRHISFMPKQRIGGSNANEISRILNCALFKSRIFK